jgi:heterogeneous nuclear ribonucleoprotein U-like protein 1
VLVSYTFNGLSQGVAFEVPKAQLENKALFPHVLSKNIRFEVNFGEREDGWNLDQRFEGDFEWTSKVSLENRVKGPRKPEEKKQCEVRATLSHLVTPMMYCLVIRSIRFC